MLPVALKFLSNEYQKFSYMRGVGRAPPELYERPRGRDADMTIVGIAPLRRSNLAHETAGKSAPAHTRGQYQALQPRKVHR
jgi:hypothetical protein